MTKRVDRRAILSELLGETHHIDKNWAMHLLNYNDYGLISEGANRLATPEGFDPERCKLFLAYCEAIGLYEQVVVRAAAQRLGVD